MARVGRAHAGRHLAQRVRCPLPWRGGASAKAVTGTVLAIVTLYDRVAEVHTAVLAVQEDEAALAAFAATLTSQPEPSPASPDWTGGSPHVR